MLPAFTFSKTGAGFGAVMLGYAVSGAWWWATSSRLMDELIPVSYRAIGVALGVALVAEIWATPPAPSWGL